MSIEVNNMKQRQTFTIGLIFGIVIAGGIAGIGIYFITNSRRGFYDLIPDESLIQSPPRSIFADLPGYDIFDPVNDIIDTGTFYRPWWDGAIQIDTTAGKTSAFQYAFDFPASKVDLDMVVQWNVFTSVTPIGDLGMLMTFTGNNTDLFRVEFYPENIPIVGYELGQTLGSIYVKILNERYLVSEFAIAANEPSSLNMSWDKGFFEINGLNKLSGTFEWNVTMSELITDQDFFRVNLDGFRIETVNIEAGIAIHSVYLELFKEATWL